MNANKNIESQNQAITRQKPKFQLSSYVSSSIKFKHMKNSTVEHINLSKFQMGEHNKWIWYHIRTSKFKTRWSQVIYMRSTKYFDLFIILERENNQLYHLAETSNRMSKCYVMVVMKFGTSENHHVVHSLIIVAFLCVSSSIKKKIDCS